MKQSPQKQEKKVMKKTKKDALKVVKTHTLKAAKKGAVKKSVETEYDIESERRIRFRRGGQ